MYAAQQEGDRSDSSSEDEQEAQDMAAAVAASLDTFFGDAGANSSEAVCNAAAVEDEEEQASQEEAHLGDAEPSSSDVLDYNVAHKEKDEASPGGSTPHGCRAQQLRGAGLQCRPQGERERPGCGRWSRQLSML